MFNLVSVMMATRWPDVEFVFTFLALAACALQYRLEEVHRHRRGSTMNNRRNQSLDTLLAQGGHFIDPATGAIIDEFDVRAQTAHVMKNLGSVLEAGGASFASVVPCGLGMNS